MLLESQVEARGRIGDRFVYLPWIPEHGDSLIALLDARGQLTAPLRVFDRAHELKQRKAINIFAMDEPDRYRNLLSQALSDLRGTVPGMLFTLDWTPPMRQAVLACRELGIPSILIPHESIFANRDAYYVDRLTGADVPLCDVVLCWGDLQRSIFEERGYPSERIHVVGSPKLDAAVSYAGQHARVVFSSLFGLDAARPIFLFALQPLDSQYDEKLARQAQTRAVLDLAELSATRSAQVIIRYPPAGHSVLAPEAVTRLRAMSHVAFDDASPYIVRPREAIFHADGVFSINSTMLLEAALMNRPAVSTRYVESKIPWEQAGVARAGSRDELAAALEQILSGAGQPAPSGRAWAAQAFSVGSFDGQSVQRITNLLQSFRATPPPASPPGTSYAHLFEDHFKSSSAVAAFEQIPPRFMQHVQSMLGFRKLLCAPSPREAQAADVFVSWGIAPKRSRQKHQEMARRLRRPQLLIEDGFLRSIDIGLSGTPGLSIICDTQTAYYDATKPSRLEDRLNGRVELTEAQQARARAAMMLIRKHRVSKYNHAPDTGREYGQGPRVLVVDQRFGDMSVEKGLADGDSFRRMLADAMARHPRHTVLVKQHPDATRGGKGAYLGAEQLAPHADDPRLLTIREDVNPHTLFDQVDAVYVVSSGMGLEALIAGLPVHCYGAPFYAGWGVTNDALRVPRRTRLRGVVELFHFALIESSRYFAPQYGRAGELEDVIAFLASRRGRLEQTP